MVKLQDPHVGGWFSEREGMALYMTANMLLPGDTAVEVGSFMGKSTRWFFIGTETSGARLTCVDPFLSSGEGEPAQIEYYYQQVAPQGSYSVWVGNLIPVCSDRFPQDVIEVLRQPSREAAKDWGALGLPKISLLFIDGQHEECLLDLQAWEPHLTDHAMVLLHDVSGTGAYGENGPDNTFYHMQQGGWTGYVRADLLAGLTRDPGWWQTRYEARTAERGAFAALDDPHDPPRWLASDGRRGPAPGDPVPPAASGAVPGDRQRERGGSDGSHEPARPDASNGNGGTDQSQA